jgi:hypothetical protein
LMKRYTNKSRIDCGCHWKGLGWENKYFLSLLRKMELLSYRFLKWGGLLASLSCWFGESVCLGYNTIAICDGRSQLVTTGAVVA